MHVTGEGDSAFTPIAGGGFSLGGNILGRRVCLMGHKYLAHAHCSAAGTRRVILQSRHHRCSSNQTPAPHDPSDQGHRFTECLSEEMAVICDEIKRDNSGLHEHLLPAPVLSALSTSQMSSKNMASWYSCTSHWFLKVALQGRLGGSAG